jgi:hypothetical protein
MIKIIKISGRQWCNTGIIMTNEWNRVIQKKGIIIWDLLLDSPWELLGL